MSILEKFAHENLNKYCEIHKSFGNYQYMIWYIIIIQEEHKYQTALIAACANGHTPVVELLIRKGANSNYQNKVRQL